MEDTTKMPGNSDHEQQLTTQGRFNQREVDQEQRCRILPIELNKEPGFIIDRTE